MTEKVLLVEDHAMMMEGLMAVFASDQRIDVVDTATSLGEFEQILPNTDATLVVADYQLPDGLGTDVPARLARAGHNMPVVIMSGVASTRVLDAAIDAGCSGYVSKSFRTQALIEAVVAAGGGASVFPADAVDRKRRGDLTSVGATLTARELEVLQQLSSSRNATEIANAFGVSVATVRNHIRAVLLKLHARSQLEAVLIAVQTGLVPMPGELADYN